MFDKSLNSDPTPRLRAIAQTKEGRAQLKRVLGDAGIAMDFAEKIRAVLAEHRQ